MSGMQLSSGQIMVFAMITKLVSPCCHRNLFEGSVGPLKAHPDAISLVVKKFPRILSLYVHCLDGWASFSKKKTDEKDQFLSRLCPKVKFLSGQVKWTLRAHFWVFFSKTLPMASFDVCTHLSLGDFL